MATEDVVAAAPAATAEAEANDGAEVDLSVPHPLQYTWVLWYDSPGKRVAQSSWFAQMKRVAEFNTVEDFWGLFNNVRVPSKITSGSNYHLFKKGIQPMWEDAANQKGGKWVVVLPKGRKDLLDAYWLNAILSIIGENFDDGDAICGCVISIRKQQDKLAVWTQDAEDEAAAMRIGRQLKLALSLGDGVTIGYQSHADSMKKSSSFAKNRYDA